MINIEKIILQIETERGRKMGSISRFWERVCTEVEGGSHYCSNKSDDICDSSDEGMGRALIMARLKCILRGLDLKAYIFMFILIPTCFFVIYLHGQKIAYFLRPLWESPPKPFPEILHFYHKNVPMEKLCALRCWGIREYPRRVFDDVLFSNEVDMLNIHWNELYPHITEFVLLESNSTSTGLQKDLVFAKNRHLFEFVEKRLTYGQIPRRLKRVRTRLLKKLTNALH